MNASETVIVAVMCFPSWWPRNFAKGGKKVPMLPSMYAKAHFKMSFAVGDFSHCQKSLIACKMSSHALLILPCLSLGHRAEPSNSSRSVDPSSSSGLMRRLICRRSRSPVPGNMKVPFFSFCDGAFSRCSSIGLGGLTYTTFRVMQRFSGEPTARG